VPLNYQIFKMIQIVLKLKVYFYIKIGKYILMAKYLVEEKVNSSDTIDLSQRLRVCVTTEAQANTILCMLDTGLVVGACSCCFTATMQMKREVQTLRH